MEWRGRLYSGAAKITDNISGEIILATFYALFSGIHNGACMEQIIDAAIPGFWALIATVVIMFLWGFAFPETKKERDLRREARSEMRRLKALTLACTRNRNMNAAETLHLHQKNLSLGMNRSDLEKRIVSQCGNPTSFGMVYPRLMQPLKERVVDATGTGDNEIWKLTPFGEVVVRVLNERHRWKAEDSFLFRGKLTPKKTEHAKSEPPS